MLFHKQSILKLSVAAVLTVAQLSLYSGVHAAVIGKLIRPYMSYSMTVDDNILRIRDQMDSEALLGTNDLFDISHRFLGGAIVNKQISRQQLHFNGNWSHNRYERFSQINNNAYDLQGNWNWFLGNRLEGNMGANFNKGQAPFLFQPGLINIRTQHTEYFNFNWRYHPSWRLRGDYTHFDFKTDNPVLQFQNRREDRFETGWDYVASSGSTFGLQYRHIRGEFTSPIHTVAGIFSENNYNQNEIKGRVDWKISGKSQIKLLGGWVERKNETFSASDFNGFNVRLSYLWKPTSKLYITLSGWRETIAIQTLTANFSLNTGGSSSASWQVTHKTKLNGNFSYNTQHFDSFAGVTNQFSGFGNKNQITKASLELTYTPLYGTEISATAFLTSLSTSSARGGFDAHGATLSLRYILGRQ